MTRSSAGDALSAKRALLRQQTERLGEELPWLSDPALIPPDALARPAGQSDLPGQCFHLAAWMLEQIVQAANSIAHQLSWEATLRRYQVEADLEPRVLRAVLEPMSRHAPGILAMSEIVAAAAQVAARDGVPRTEWARVARASERFAAGMSRDGTDVQVFVRQYLRKPAGAQSAAAPAELDPALLRLDDDLGMSTVTPIADILAAARGAAAEFIGAPGGVCVALQAKAPACPHAPPAAAPTMYGAIWAAYVAAADRLIFPNADVKPAGIPRQARPDPNARVAMDALASRRAGELREGLPARIWREALGEMDAAARADA